MNDYTAPVGRPSRPDGLAARTGCRGNRHYGVGVLIVNPGVVVVVGLPAPVSVSAGWVGLGTAVLVSTNGHASRSIGKSVQVVPLVQMFSVSGVISGPLHSTT